MGQLILHFSNLNEKANLILPSPETEIHMLLENNVLNAGTYYLTVFLGDGFNIINDRVENCLSFEIQTATTGRIVCAAGVHLPTVWEIKPAITFTEKENNFVLEN
jgi:hypothetical protein